MAEDVYEPQYHEPHPHRIAVVGVGRVGATFAYALLLDGLVGELLLIDRDHERAEGEAMDLNHAVPLSHAVRIWAGDYPDCAGAGAEVEAARACGRALRFETVVAEILQQDEG